MFFFNSIFFKTTTFYFYYDRKNTLSYNHKNQKKFGLILNFLKCQHKNQYSDFQFYCFLMPQFRIEYYFQNVTETEINYKKLSNQDRHQNSNMLEYILNKNYREAHRFISSFGFLSSENSFHSSNFDKIREKMKSEIQNRDALFYRQCFTILANLKPKPRHLVRRLVFIHLLLQVDCSTTEEIANQISDQINKIIASSKELQIFSQQQVPKMIKKRSKSGPSHSASSSNFSNSCNFTQQAQYKHNINKSLIIPAGSSEKAYRFYSEKQILCENLIQPYCCYLLKKSSYQHGTGQKSDKSCQISMWQQINLMKLLFKITANYYTIMRYYDHKFLKLVIKLTQVLHEDIHRSYPIIAKQIKARLLAQIKRIPNYAKIMPSNKATNLEQNKQNISQEFIAPQQLRDLNQTKQLLYEIAGLNDQLVYTYRNKYIAHELRKYGLKMPELMNIDDIQCQFLLHSVKQYQKQIDQNHKLKKNCPQTTPNMNSQAKKLNKNKQIFQSHIANKQTVTTKYCSKMMLFSRQQNLYQSQMNGEDVK